MAATSALAGFTQLNDSVYFRKASDSNQPSIQHAAGQPDIILLLSWGGAPLRLVAKYTNAYANLYPSAPLLVIQTEFSHILRHTSTSQDAALEPALGLLQDHIQNPSNPSGVRPGRLLVHVFSNGGSYKLMEIAKRYKTRYGACMPMNALILDSTPGVPTLGRSFKAISFALPKLWVLRWPLQMLLMCFLVIHRLLEKTVLGEGGMRTGRRLMNDPNMISKNAPRCYIYGPKDELIAARDVKEHAADARAHGYDVTEEVFLTTPHVAHMRGDPERYWEKVKKTWKSSTTI